MSQIISHNATPPWLKLVRKEYKKGGHEALHASGTNTSKASSFFFPSRLREDAWVELKQLCMNLISAGTKPDDELSRQIEIRLDKLDKVESYWGFPGRDNFDVLSELFKQAHYQRFATLVLHIAPVINNQAYRRTKFTLDIMEWDDVRSSPFQADDETDATHKGYFRCYWWTKIVKVVLISDELCSVISVATMTHLPMRFWSLSHSKMQCVPYCSTVRFNPSW
jgi:hypothetical protein